MVPVTILLTCLVVLSDTVESAPLFILLTAPLISELVIATAADVSATAGKFDSADCTGPGTLSAELTAKLIADTCWRPL